MGTLITIFLSGLPVGILLEQLSIFLIKKRTTANIPVFFSGSIIHTACWAAVGGLGLLTSAMISGFTLTFVELALMFCTCLVLTVVDITIRKIPNELILFILIVGAISALFHHSLGEMKINIIGFVVGFILFMLPAFFNKGAGMGDVKFAAVVGLYLGVYNFLVAVVLMSAILLIYTLYMVVFRKGNFKTKVALGPFMAAGFLTVLAISILNSKTMFFDLGLYFHR